MPAATPAAPAAMPAASSASVPGALAAIPVALPAAGAAGTGFGDATWPALGMSARLLTTDPARLGDAVEIVTGQLDELDLAASRFRPDSEVSTLARGRPRRVSPLLLAALVAALRAARLTGGAVDPTVGGSLAALGYDRDFAAVPADDPKARLVVRRAPGWRSVRIDPDAGTVRVPPGTVLDLGATAKALASDRAANAAALATGSGVLVSLGGDVAVRGRAPGEGWPIGVADDHRDRRPPTTVLVRSGGLATSSTSLRRWRRGGETVHHILDPRTGRPAQPVWRTVSVAAPSCVAANTLSTAAIVWGAEAPLRLRAAGVPARLVSEEGEVVTTGGWPD
jgi:FAD:protein FMN transferase